MNTATPENSGPTPAATRAISEGNHTLPLALAPHCASIRNAADAVSAIGAVLHRDAIARECEDEGEPLGSSVLDGLYAGIEELGDLIVTRVEALERHCRVALPGGEAGGAPE